MDIERASRSNVSVYLAMLDLDFFKVVNDTYGHSVGDEVLKATAQAIHNAVRSYDLTARYGGEEFLLLLENIDETGALGLVERLRKNIEENDIEAEGKKIHITCSLGLVRYQDSESLEKTIDKADKAMYKAKEAGRNIVKLYDEQS
jgi:diguanylate cyclase (GGDEF)-like protein